MVRNRSVRARLCRRNHQLRRNNVVDFTAESILQCDISSLTEPPPTETGDWVVTFAGVPSSEGQADWGGNTQRQVLGGAALSASGTQARVTFTAGIEVGCEIGSVYIGHQRPLAMFTTSTETRLSSSSLDRRQSRSVRARLSSVTLRSLRWMRREISSSQSGILAQAVFVPLVGQLVRPIGSRRESTTQRRPTQLDTTSTPRRPVVA
ncbi:hypothetical protein ACVIYL_000675 [Bradyrhizobium sp. USDA 3315]